MARIQLRHYKRAGGVAAALGALVLVTSSAASAIGSSPHVPPPPAQPTSADQIQNVDQVKTAIKAYYGDTLTNTLDPVTGTVKLHVASPTGAYAQEMAGIEADAAKYLAHPPQDSMHPASDGKPAVLFDVDDTVLSTYNYEIYSNFVYNPTSNAAFVNGAAFPATPGMPGLVSQAQSEGYTVFFLTGRPVGQRSGTETNLTAAGYPVTTVTPADPANPDNVYLKDQTKSWLSSCAPTCNTIQYKSLTRQHIESLGYNIVADFGDQYSDLTGGFTDQTFKLPNPMYYLP